jgi:ribonuclease T2
MARTRLLTVGIALLAVAGAAPSQSHRNRQRSIRASAPFDYYLLTLSWAPDFCATAGANQDPRECGAGRHIGFVVHGLWPQANQGRGPESCGHASPVSQSIVALMLNYIPTESLIQHEWQTHGTCTGLSADDYFAEVRKARDDLTIPAVFVSLSQTVTESAAQIETQLATANPSYPPVSFRATCTGGMLQEARICLDKTLKPQACTASAGECTAPSMKILPLR